MLLDHAIGGGRGATAVLWGKSLNLIVVVSALCADVELQARRYTSLRRWRFGVPLDSGGQGVVFSVVQFEQKKNHTGGFISSWPEVDLGFAR